MGKGYRSRRALLRRLSTRNEEHDRYDRYDHIDVPDNEPEEKRAAALLEFGIIVTDEDDSLPGSEGSRRRNDQLIGILDSL
jgi:hypothetical protein